MKNYNQGKIIVIVAPSGTGKSTLISRLKEEFPQIRESVSHTTRRIREGEVDGVNYFFIDDDEFQRKIKENDFIEWAEVHSNYYGTSRSFVEDCIERGEHLLFDLDVKGADSFKQIFGSRANIIFLEPPSLEALKERLVSRGTEPSKVIEERINNARKELERKQDFDHLVMNNDIEVAYQKLKEVFRSIVKR